MISCELLGISCADDDQQSRAVKGLVLVVQAYSQRFKARMVQRLSGPNAVSANQLAKEVGVAQATLSTWLRAARKLPARVKEKETDSPAPARRPSDWTTDEKLQAVFEASALSEGELGEFLRRKGLHESDVAAWKAQVVAGGRSALDGADASRKGKKTAGSARETRELQKQVRALEKELQRKEKALAEAAALLVLKKKVQALFGEEDDEPAGKNER